MADAVEIKSNDGGDLLVRLSEIIFITQARSTYNVHMRTGNALSIDPQSYVKLRAALTT